MFGVEDVDEEIAVFNADHCECCVELRFQVIEVESWRLRRWQISYYREITRAPRFTTASYHLCMYSLIVLYGKEKNNSLQLSSTHN